jgi:hypothetical protein
VRFCVGREAARAISRPGVPVPSFGVQLSRDGRDHHPPCSAIRSRAARLLSLCGSRHLGLWPEQKGNALRLIRGLISRCQCSLGSRRDASRWRSVRSGPPLPPFHPQQGHLSPAPEQDASRKRSETRLDSSARRLAGTRLGFARRLLGIDLLAPPRARL